MTSLVCANPTCGNEFAPDPRQPLKKYCCDTCRRRVLKRKYRSTHKYRPTMRKCANPECGGMFEGKRANTIYCSEQCRNRVKNIKEIERRRAEAPPKPEPKRPGIAPLRTRHITAARAREMERIDMVVAKAKAAGTVGIDFWNDRQLAGRRIHATKVG